MTTSEPAAAPGPHLLVVEDEPVIASLLADVLGKFGYRVTQRHRVDDALQCARDTGDFALCISDFLLPDKTGLDFARALKLVRPQLRIVLISAYLEPELVAKVKEEPTVALVIRKPLDIFDLKDRVDELLGRAAPTSGGTSDHTREASC